MSYNEKLENHIDHFFIKNEFVTKNKDMDGVGWLINGNMCIGIYEDLLVSRVDPKIVDELIKEPGITLFAHQERQEDSFLAIIKKIYKREPALHKFLNHAAKYTATLPPKDSALADIDPNKSE